MMILSLNTREGISRTKWALLGMMALIATAACGAVGSPAASEPSVSPTSPAGAAGDQGAPTPLSAIPGEKIRVVTTLYPLEYFAQRIGGDSAEVANLIAPGVEAHDFEPTPDDIRTLDAADVVLYNGAGFDPWMEGALRAISPQERVVVEASRGLAVIESDDDEHDQAGEAHEGEDGHSPINPHVWLDPLKAIEQAKLVREGLVQANPAGADVYRANADALIAELEALHQQFHSGLNSCRHDTFVTSHSAFAYLAARYGLEEVSISGISPEAEPSPRDLARLADVIQDLGVKYVMMEVIVSPALAQTLATEAGAQLLTLHPLESLTPEEASQGETYVSIMQKNLENLRTALECS